MPPRDTCSEGRTGWFVRWSPSVILRVPLMDRCEVHAEYFNTFARRDGIDSNRAFFSPGMHSLLTKRLEVGGRVGRGIAPLAAPFLSDAGFGWRW